MLFSRRSRIPFLSDDIILGCLVWLRTVEEPSNETRLRAGWTGWGRKPYFA
jgi:hypothetical protein